MIPFSLIELFDLRVDASATDFDKLAAIALERRCAAVCIPPFWVKKVSRLLAETSTGLATVVGYPYGYQMTQTKIIEIEQAIKDGADEINFMTNISAFRSDMQWTKIEFAQAAKMCHERDVPIKAIIPVTLLSIDELRRLTKYCVDAGADFISFTTKGQDAHQLKGTLTELHSLTLSDTGLKVDLDGFNHSLLDFLIRKDVQRIGLDINVLPKD